MLNFQGGPEGSRGGPKLFWRAHARKSMGPPWDLRLIRPCSKVVFFHWYLSNFLHKISSESYNQMYFVQDTLSRAFTFWPVSEKEEGYVVAIRICGGERFLLSAILRFSTLWTNLNTNKLWTIFLIYLSYRHRDGVTNPTFYGLVRKRGGAKGKRG